ncbi:MAG: helix-turn-helix transcriptional regulator [Clostridiales bacterium]|nr:helix-turn-helix transcriptional regulator [Clostridiales bacterium]
MKDRIRKIRKSLHLTQSDFGKKIGVKGNTITNYEVGIRNPSDAVIFSICREFDVNEDWLRNGGNDDEMFIKKTRTQEISEFAGKLLKEKDSFRRKLVEALAQLDEEEWKLLENIAKKMVSKKD